MPHLKFLVVGALVLGAVTYLMFSGISDSMVYYYTVSETLEQAEDLAGRGIRVSGYVTPGSISRYASESRVEFLIFDRESDHTLAANYQGIIPDTFKDNAEVIVEGRYSLQDELFHANVLLAKCPSKYEALGTEHPQDIPIKKEAD